MKLLTILFLFFVSTAFAVDFVIPEVNTKFTALDTSIAAIEALADGKILMGNGSGASAEVTPSGDVTMTNAGVNAIAAGVVTEADQLVASADGLHLKRVARATWDFGVDGGAAGAIGLGVTIPAKALINFAYWYTVTQVIDAGAGTGALSCEDADNLFAAADVTGNAAKAVVLGVPQNSAATMVKDIAAACELTWTIATADATAGKLIFFVEYTVIE